MAAHQFTKAELFYLENNLDKPVEEIADDIKCHIRTVKKKVDSLKKIKSKAERLAAKEAKKKPKPLNEVKADDFKNTEDKAKETQGESVIKKRTNFMVDKGVISYTGAQSIHDDGDGQGNAGNAPKSNSKINEQFMTEYKNSVRITEPSL